MRPGGGGPDPRTRIEREELARGGVPAGTPPVEPRPAATVVAARPAAASFEVLLLERARASRFAPGAFVFPGGVVDEDDAAPFWADRIPPTREPAACVAALRELFEETGLLPSGAGPTREDRETLLRDERLFSEIARRHGLDFSTAPIIYFSRWITPRTLARRYDTRFFLLALPEGEGDVRLTPEHESARWTPPGRALERFGEGGLPLLFPTRKTLERLATFDSLSRAIRVLRELPVEAVLATLAVTGDRVRPLMPGDPGYDDAW